jgi:SAM-dependent methyltransferase
VSLLQDLLPARLAAQLPRFFFSAPPAIDASSNLDRAEAFATLGQYDAMTRSLRRALDAGLTNAAEWGRLIRLMPTANFGPKDGRFAPLVERALRSEWIDGAGLVRLSVLLLREGGIVRAGGKITAPSVADAGHDRFFRDPLLLALLERTLVVDVELERVLIRVRRALLTACATGRASLKRREPFIAALALQCFNNEYMYPESAAERRMVETLIAKLEKRPSPAALLVLGCYRPLHTFGAPAHESAGQSEAFRTVLERQVEQPALERRLRDSIKSHPSTGDPVSELVRTQYEESPYPRWITLEQQQPVEFADNLRLWFPHFSPPELLSGRRPLDVLIAGCGTGRHVILRALRFPTARYLAIDLSLASLSYAKRSAKAFGVENIEFERADILGLPSGPPRFDVVECGGVLNCFDDPLAGWSKLVEQLRPGGVLCIALYSHHARKVVREAWEFVEKSPREMTLDEMRAARQAIMDLPGDHPLRRLTLASDFYSLSGCRDLIFHVQEKQFTIPEIKTMLERLGLAFVGFELTYPAVPTAYALRFPDDPTQTNLDRWDLFEREHPDLFSGMYQFWCQKPEDPTPRTAR